LDIVLITRDRPELTKQTIESMKKNAADWSKHRLLVVFDGWPAELSDVMHPLLESDLNMGVSIRWTGKQLGVGGAKNFGAETLWVDNEHYDSLLMFSDNDMYYLPGWDENLSLSFSDPITQLGGWRHPFHKKGKGILIGTAQRSQKDPHVGIEYNSFEVDAVTGNCFVMRWNDWMNYGPFDSNALGPGQSEDFALSQKIKAGGGVVATLDPPVAIHCGLGNSEGKPATGWMEMKAMALEQAKQWPEEKFMLWMPKPGEIAREVIHDLASPVPGQSSSKLDYSYLKHAYGPEGTPEERKAARDKFVAERAAEGVSVTPIDLGLKGMKVEGFARQSLLQDHVLHPSGLLLVRTDHPTHSRVITQSPFLKYLDSLPKLLSLNIGSGQRPFTTTGERQWINVDSQSIPPDRVPDILCDVGKERLPFKDGEVEMIVLHHVLEHFGCGEGESMLKECWRVLRSGGSMLVFVPDMKALAGRWLGGELDDQLFFTNAYGAYMGDEADRHKWGFTHDSLFWYLENILRGKEKIALFDWREIPGSDIAKDWWILGVEVIKR